MKKIIGLIAAVMFSVAVAGCSKGGHATSAANQAANSAAVSQAAGGH